MDAPDRGAAQAGSPAEAETTATGVHALDLGSRLRAERLRQGMSLREMARRLGVSASALSQIETGKAQPSVSKLFDIVNLLNTSLDGLLVGDPAQRTADRAPLRPDRDGARAPSRDREVEAMKARARSAERFPSAAT